MSARKALCLLLFLFLPAGSVLAQEEEADTAGESDAEPADEEPPVEEPPVEEPPVEEPAKVSEPPEAEPVVEAPPPPTAKSPSPALSFLTETIRWTGYYENQLAIYSLPRNDHADPDGWPVDVLDYNKAKLGIRFKPSRGFGVQVDLVARSFHGSDYHLADMLPERFGDTLAFLEAMDPASVRFSLDNEIYLENAFLTAQAGRFRLRVGKQPIRFGSGYLWNPSDPFNVIDMLDPSYEKQGVTALKMQLHLPHEILLEAYALPDPFTYTTTRLEDSAVAARMRAAFGQFVLAGHWAWMVDTAGVDLLATDPAEYELRSRRHLVGLEFVGEIGGVGFWLEGAYNRMPRDDWDDIEAISKEGWFETLAGVSYTFPGGFTTMAEYVYNGRGYNDPEDISLWQWFAYIEQRLRYLSQHQVAVTMQLPISRAFTTIGLTGIVNPASPGFILNPSVQFNWSQHVTVMLYGAISYARDPDSEFAAVGQGAYLRFRLSF